VHTHTGSSNTVAREPPEGERYSWQLRRIRPLFVIKVQSLVKYGMYRSCSGGGGGGGGTLLLMLCVVSYFDTLSLF
jgi:hypothetical protein